jgi:hypothetical protein
MTTKSPAKSSNNPPSEDAVEKLDSPALSQLQSEEQGRLLDMISQLRAQDVNKHIALPILVVCGDQSSGKSSVLEAISGVKFPTKDAFCTQFATEFSLRRTAETSTTVHIRPGRSRSKQERKRLETFKCTFTSMDDFPRVIEQAKAHMQIGANSFAEDTLCVESHGPDRPHLLMVSTLERGKKKVMCARDIYKDSGRFAWYHSCQQRRPVG